MLNIPKPQTLRSFSFLIPRSSFLVQRGVWLGPVAWLVALGALALLQAEPGRTLALGVLVGAGVLAVLAWGRVRWVRGLAPVSAGPLVIWDRGRLARLGGLAVAGGLVWAADTQFLAQQYDPFGPAGLLWLASMGVLLAATITWPQRPASPVPAALAGTSLPVRRVGEPRDAPVVLAPADPAPAPAWLAAPPAWVRWEVAALAALVVLALAVRVWRLQDLPYVVHGDEVLTGRTAITGYLGVQPAPVFSTLWPGIDLPALWFFLVAIPLKLGGVSLAMVRLPAALFGTALVPAFYGLVRSVWGRAAALAGTAVLATSAVDIQYSRVTINNIVTPFFWTVCFFFLLRGLRTRRPVDWVLAGIAGGLSEHFYYGTHLLPFLLVAFCGYLLLVHWRQGWRTLGHFGLLALGYLAAFGPLLAYFIRVRPDIYFGRAASQGALMWDHIPRDLPDLALMWNTLWPLMADNLLGFTTRSDQGTFYWAPLLMIGEGALLVLGTALLIWRWRHPAAFLLLISGAGALFVGGTLIHGTPFIMHWTPAFPAFYAAIAIPLGAWAASWRRLPRRRQAAGPLALAVLVGLNGLFNLDFYFNRYYVPRPDFEIHSALGRWAAAQGAGTRIYVVGRTWQGYDPELGQYLVAGQTGDTLYNPASQLPLPGGVGQGLGFAFFGDDEQYRSVVAALYPGGQADEVRSHDGVHLFYTYRLTPAQAAQTRGVYAQVFDPRGSNPLWTGVVGGIGALPAGTTYPLRARWSGAFYQSQWLLTALTAEGATAPLWIDGQPVAPDERRQLYTGWHYFMIEATLDRPQAIRLRLGGSNGAGPSPATADLWPAPPGQGLLAGVGTPQAETSTPEIDPFLGFTALGSPIVAGPGQRGLPTRVRWVGDLLAPATGSYILELRATGAAQLSLDGQALLRVCATGDAVSMTTTLKLTPDPRPLQMDYAAVGEPQILELYWTPPDGPRTLVPPAAFRYQSPGGDPPPVPARPASPCGGP